MLNAAQEFVTALIERRVATGGPARYLAPHAPRPTPRKPHYSRAEERAAAEKRYREGLKKPQPRKYLNASARLAERYKSDKDAA